MGASHATIWHHSVLGSLLLPQGRQNFVPHPFLEERACTCITLSSAGCCSSAKQAISHQPRSLLLRFSGTSSQNAFPVLCSSSPESPHTGLSGGKKLAGWGYSILDWQGFVGISIFRITEVIHIAQVPHKTCTCGGSGNTSPHSAISHFPVIKRNACLRTLLSAFSYPCLQNHRIRIVE